MKTSVTIHLYATLARLMPDSAENYPIVRGMPVSDLLDELGVPKDQAKLIFINGVKGNLSSLLEGGERIGVFPPVGGG